MGLRYFLQLLFSEVLITQQPLKAGKKSEDRFGILTILDFFGLSHYKNNQILFTLISHRFLLTTKVTTLLLPILLGERASLFGSGNTN
jgi:hypothetical protein